MNDYHLDPPDFPDPPQCLAEGCSGSGDFARLSADTNYDIFTCDECGREWSIPHPCEWSYESEATDAMHTEMCDEFQPDSDPLCPHGNIWGECSACDYLGDIAFDAARERRCR